MQGNSDEYWKSTHQQPSMKCRQDRTNHVVQGKINSKSRGHVVADPCAYSLYSSDSEDQVMMVCRGLEHCESILNSLLLKPNKESANSHVVTHHGKLGAGEARQLAPPKRSSTHGSKMKQLHGAKKQEAHITDHESVTIMKNKCPSSRQNHQVIQSSSKSVKTAASHGNKETNQVKAPATVDVMRQPRYDAGERPLEHNQFTGQQGGLTSRRQKQQRRLHSALSSMPTHTGYHQQRMPPTVFYPCYPVFDPFFAPGINISPPMTTNNDPAVLLRQPQSVKETSGNQQQWPLHTLPFACPPGMCSRLYNVNATAAKPTQQTGSDLVKSQEVRARLSETIGKLKSLAAATGHCEIMDLVEVIDEDLTYVGMDSAVHIDRDSEQVDIVKRLESERKELRCEIERLQKRLEDMERKLTAAQSSSLYKTVAQLKCEMDKMEENTAEMVEAMALLKSQNEVLGKAVHSSRQEVSAAMESLIIKEKENCNLQHTTDHEICSMRRTVRQSEAQQQMTQLSLQACEKRNSILKLALQQQGAEIAILKDQVLGLRQCVGGLLVDKTKRQMVSKMLDTEKHWITPSVTLQQLEHLAGDSVKESSPFTGCPDNNHQHSVCSTSHGRLSDGFEFAAADVSGSLPDSGVHVQLVRKGIAHKSSDFTPPAVNSDGIIMPGFDIQKWLKQASVGTISKSASLDSDTDLSATGSVPNLAVDQNNKHISDLDCNGITALNVEDKQSGDLLSCTSTATWSVSEADFRRDLAALDAGIVQLQKQLVK